LTRLGLDPWEEAARLTPLPKARAAEALAKDCSIAHPTNHDRSRIETAAAAKERRKQ